MMKLFVTVVAVLSFSAFPAPVSGQTPAPNFESPGATLRISLSQLLSEHIFLAAEAMRTASSNSPAQSAAADALEENSGAIEAAVASIYGADAGSSFGTLWREHIQHLLDYAVATRSSDEAGKTAALQGLAHHGVALASFLGDANPQLAAEPVAEALQRHNNQLVALLEQDPPTAFTTEREAYRHMFDVGDLLAQAIVTEFPDRFGPPQMSFSPSVSLWLTLGRLLGEHLILSAETMRAGGGTAGETAAAAREAVSLNAVDLGAAFASIYGVDAGAEFKASWDTHIQAYFAYIDAVTAGDLAQQQARRDELTDYAATFATYMAAVNPYLEADALAGMISHHTQALIYQVDAYYAGDYARAYDEVAQAYAHMFDVAKAFAAALVAHHPELFQLPDTAAPQLTSPTPKASDHTLRVSLWALLSSLAVILALWDRPRARREECVVNSRP
jgi:hypothetical protein